MPEFAFKPVARLGESRIESPLRKKFGEMEFTDENARVIAFDDPALLGTDKAFVFERAGARERIFHDPSKTTAAIVTCGGLCPGLNDVIRSATLELHHNYGVKRVLGIRYGYLGLNPSSGHEPIVLEPDSVESIHRLGGTHLASSRGPQDCAVMAEYLKKLGVNVLLCVGGDGTQRGAFALSQQCRKMNMPVSVVGVPKTIDNDVAFCERSFGFTTAVAMAAMAVSAAHEEARGALYGIGLVKLMGRDAGFISAGAALASQDVNFCLIPEQPFALDGARGLLAMVEKRLHDRGHAVIAAAEGAGQELFASDDQTDASGNRRLGDIGVLLKEKIEAHFKSKQMPITLKYIDPSYMIRSVPANTEDSILADAYARMAVHAAMAGRTEMVLCFTRGTFAHVPSELLTSTKKRMPLSSPLWRGVLSTTGQPAVMG